MQSIDQSKLRFKSGYVMYGNDRMLFSNWW